MKVDIFHLKIKEKEISYKFSGVPFTSDLADEMAEEEAYVVKILHKVLNIQLPLKESAVMEREDFAALGKKLSGILFPDDSIKGVLSQKFERAQEETGYKCRLILEFDRSTSEIASLPWEYLYYEPKDAYGNLMGSGEFLGADSKRSFDLIRKIPFGDIRLDQDGPKVNEIELPLKILLVTSNPDGEYHVPSIDSVVEYFERLQVEFPEMVQVEYITQPSFSKFQQALKDLIDGHNRDAPFVPDILHFAGHGILTKGQGKIAFVQPDGQGRFREEWIADNDFADFFEEIKKPYMVFLQICEGAKIADYQNNKGLALQLLSKKIPAVVAIQNPVAEWITREFVKIVYLHFLKGADIATAVTEGRFHLARKLEIPDHEGNKKENYGHKAFGSPAVFISTEEPVRIYREEMVEAPKEEPKPVHKPQVGSERAVSGGASIAVTSEQAGQTGSGGRETQETEPVQVPPVAPQEEILQTVPVETVEDATAARATSTSTGPAKSKRLEDLIENVRKETRKNELFVALGIIIKSLSIQSRLYDRVCNYETQLKTAQTRYHDGMIKIDDFQIVENTIRMAVLQILRELDERDLL